MFTFSIFRPVFLVFYVRNEPRKLGKLARLVRLHLEKNSNDVLIVCELTLFSQNLFKLSRKSCQTIAFLQKFHNFSTDTYLTPTFGPADLYTV